VVVVNYHVKFRCVPMLAFQVHVQTFCENGVMYEV